MFFCDELEEYPICESEKVIIKITSFAGNEASEYSSNVNQLGIGQNMSPEIKEEAEKENKPNGFGGWLILLSIIIVLIPLILL